MQKVLPPKRNPSFSRIRAVVVSIHDVSPATRDRTEQIIEDLAASGVDRLSLLVIPDHHHRGLISSDPTFVQWLQDQCGRRHEAVLHGFYHIRGAEASDGPWKRLITQSYTAGEGEFFDLGEEEAFDLLMRGKSSLEECGVSPAGFIAPAWLLGPDAEKAVRRAGFAYTTRIGTFTDLETNRVLRSRSLVWSVRAGWRRLCSLGWNAWVWEREAANDLLRIGIHPPDWNYRAIRNQILNLSRRAAQERTPMTYESWLSQRRNP